MQIFETFGIAGSAGVVIGAVVLSGLRLYARAYLDRKAANLADKEDIDAITKIVESIKHDNELKLAQVTEALRAQTSLRLLAGERRIETHQKAYVLWQEMLDLIHQDGGTMRAELKEECREFYLANCLYLDAAVRMAFIDALTSYDVHLDLLRGQHGTPANNREQMAVAITNNMQRVKNLGHAIEAACDLPSIGSEFGTSQ